MYSAGNTHSHAGQSTAAKQSAIKWFLLLTTYTNKNTTKHDALPHYSVK